MRGQTDRADRPELITLKFASRKSERMIGFVPRVRPLPTC